LFNAIVACLAIISRLLSLCATVNIGDAWYVVWICMYGCCRENIREIQCFRPSEHVWRRRDLQKQTQVHSQALTQAENSRFERGTISLKQEGLA